MKNIFTKAFTIVSYYPTPEKVYRTLQIFDKYEDSTNIEIYKLKPLYTKHRNTINRNPYYNPDIYLSCPDLLYFVYKINDEKHIKIYSGEQKFLMSALNQWHKIKVEADYLIQNMDKDVLMDLYKFLEATLKVVKLY